MMKCMDYRIKSCPTEVSPENQAVPTGGHEEGQGVGGAPSSHLQAHAQEHLVVGLRHMAFKRPSKGIKTEFKRALNSF